MRAFTKADVPDKKDPDKIRDVLKAICNPQSNLRLDEFITQKLNKSTTNNQITIFYAATYQGRENQRRVPC